MAEKRLIGSDGALFVGDFGTEVIEGETLDDGTFYEIVAVGGSTVFPAGAEEGYLIKGAGETLGTGDIAKPFEGIPMCDIQSWAMDFSKAEVETTTLCDNEKTYRASKYDEISGTMEGIMINGITDEPNALLNRFVNIVSQDSSSYTISPKMGSSLYAQLITDDTTEVGEDFSFYFLPVVLTGFSASAGGDEAQAFSSPFRAGSSTSGVTYYKFEN